MHEDLCHDSGIESYLKQMVENGTSRLKPITLEVYARLLQTLLPSGWVNAGSELVDVAKKDESVSCGLPTFGNGHSHCHQGSS